VKSILRKRVSGSPDDTLVLPAGEDSLTAELAAATAPPLPAAPPPGAPAVEPPPVAAPAAEASPAADAPSKAKKAKKAKEPKTPKAPNTPEPAKAASDAELVAQRDRLSERFAVMQCELGGLFYEMAIRDHVRMDVLIERAAALQRVDAELGQVERMLETGASAAGGACLSCGAIYARGAAFCAQCAQPVTQT